MSLNKLIDLTNKANFYDEGIIQLHSLYSTSKNCRDITFDFETGSKVNNHTQLWRLDVSNCYSIHNLFLETYLPYVRLKLMEDHPLLWDYKYSNLNCEIRGVPKNINQLIGDIVYLYEKSTGNWINPSLTFFKFKEYYEFNEYTRSFTINEKLKAPLEILFESHKIDFIVKSKNTPLTFKSNNKIPQLLMFGNPIVTDYLFNLNQPYIIGDQFICKSINL